VSITTPGQNACITFSGTQNHKLSINLTGGTLSGTVNAGCTLTTLAPGGSFLAGNKNCYAASNFLDIGVLPSTGTYTVVIGPGGIQRETPTFNSMTIPTSTSVSQQTAQAIR